MEFEIEFESESLALKRGKEECELLEIICEAHLNYHGNNLYVNSIEVIQIFDEIGHLVKMEDLSDMDRLMIGKKAFDYAIEKCSQWEADLDEARGESQYELSEDK